MSEFTDAEFIEIMRKTYADLVKRPSDYSPAGRINLACWLGERTKRMLAIIDAKQAENAALQDRIAAITHEWEITVTSRAYARAELERLEKENAALKEQLRRIPTSERMPEQGVWVRVWINGTESIAKYRARPRMWEPSTACTTKVRSLTG